MRVVLATPPRSPQRNTGNYLPPMHLAYIGASVREMEEVQVVLVDAGGEGLLVDDAADRILEADPDLIGLSVTSCDIRRSLQLLVLVKAARPDVTTVLGGQHPTSFDRLFLEHVPQVDMVMRGEVDLSFPELLRRLADNESIADVPGLSYRADGKIIRGRPQVVWDLDAVEFPDRSLYDEKNYFLNVLGIDLGQTQLLRATPIITSRGCPHQCTFCSKLTPRHHKYRARSPENILQEILQLNRENYELIVFTDENFTFDVGRLKRICQLLVRQNLNMRFIFQGTVHNLSQPTLRLMRSAGFVMAIVGIESGSDSQLKRYRKAASSGAIAAGIGRAKEAGLLVHGSFIYGGPGETAGDRAATRRFIRNVRLHSCTMYELSLYPGTEIWDNLCGNSPPKTLEDTRNRTITSIPHQIDGEAIVVEIKRFWRAFAASWFHYSRLLDLMLLANNPLFRLVQNKRGVFSMLWAFLQLLGGRQRYR